MAVKLIPSQFSGKDKEGDFRWMIERREYADALFIFNDNEEQFRAFRQNPRAGTSGCQVGNGNAIIRPYQCVNPPRAAGIPTGPGYLKLEETVRRVIDEALSVVKERVNSGRYRRIYYSAANSRGDLGTDIFAVGDDVKRYIVDGLRKLAQ